jgi:hypothetical protein
MKRKFQIPVFLFLLLIFPQLLLADCVPVGYFDNFIVEGDHTVILYTGSVPIVKFDVSCKVGPTSKIRLLKVSACEGDDIEIDGSACTILSVNLQ